MKRKLLWKIFFIYPIILDEKKIVMENIFAIKRAGADIIITYHAKDIAKWLITK